MAAAIANKLFGERGIKAAADSCGVFAADGANASMNSIETMKDGWDIDISGHKAKITNEILLDNADIVVTMTMGHKSHIISLYPNFADKVYAIEELDGEGRDIDDPFGASLDIYMQCARQIGQFIESFEWE